MPPRRSLATPGSSSSTCRCSCPGLGLEWALTNLATLRADLLDLWPGCADLLSTQIAFGLEFADKMMNLETSAKAELARIHANETMAAIFDEVDFVICATNPDVAYPAEVQMNTRVGDQKVGPENNGALTIPANICGNPAISIPVAPGRRAARRDADHGQAPRGRPAARPGPPRRAHLPVAPRGARRARVRTPLTWAFSRGVTDVGARSESLSHPLG